ncbi:DUF1330 domain-containing protein [Rhizorhabdus wittichii]
MPAIMIVCMTMETDDWTQRYFVDVPALLKEYGASQLCGGRDVELLEGDGTAPDRAAVFEFPDLASVRRFMADPRYQPYLTERRAGSRSNIYLFENALVSGRLV